MKKILKENKGITLVALVITIVVLLILAGVAIATLSGENNIITKSREAREKHEIKANEEEIELANYEAKIEEYTGNTNVWKKYGLTTEDITYNCDYTGDFTMALLTDGSVYSSIGPISASDVAEAYKNGAMTVTSNSITLDMDSLSIEYRIGNNKIDVIYQTIEDGNPTINTVTLTKTNNPRNSL